MGKSVGRGPSMQSVAHGPRFSPPFSDNLSSHETMKNECGARSVSISSTTQLGNYGEKMVGREPSISSTAHGPPFFPQLISDNLSGNRTLLKCRIVQR